MDSTTKISNICDIYKLYKKYSAIIPRNKANDKMIIDRGFSVFNLYPYLCCRADGRITAMFYTQLRL